MIAKYFRFIFFSFVLIGLTSSCEDKNRQSFGELSLTFDYQSEINSDNTNQNNDDNNSSNETLNPKYTGFYSKELKSVDSPKMDINVDNNNNLIQPSESLKQDYCCARITINSGTPLTLDLNSQNTYSETVPKGSTLIEVDLLTSNNLVLYNAVKSVQVAEDVTTSVSFLQSDWLVQNQEIELTTSFNSNYTVGDEITLNWTNTHTARGVKIELFQNNPSNVLSTITENYVGNSYVFDTENQTPRNDLGINIKSMLNATAYGRCCFNIVSGGGGGNSAPSTNDINVTIDENRFNLDYVSTSNRQIDITLDGFDPDGDNLSYDLVQFASNGNTYLEGSTLRYIPNQDWNGVEVITYKANDGLNDSNISTITITVVPVNDAPIVTTNINSQSLYFEGIDSFTVFNNSELRYLTNYSLSMWVNFESSSSWAGLLAKGYLEGSDNGFTIRRANDNNKIRVSTSTSDGFENILESTSIFTSSSGWNHVVVQKDDNAITLYINGVLEDQHSIQSSTQMFDNPQDFVFAKGNGTSEYMQGWIDDFVLYRNALTQTEISELYNNGNWESPSQVKPTGMMFHYRLDGSIKDFSGRNTPSTNNGADFVPTAPGDSSTLVDAEDDVSIYVSTNENQSVSINLAESVVDIDSSNLTYQIVSDVSNGSTTLSGNSVNYEPSSGFIGHDSFSFNVSDGIQVSNTVRVYIEVNQSSTEADAISLAGEHDYINLGSAIDLSSYFSIFTRMKIDGLDDNGGLSSNADGSLLSTGQGSTNQGFYFYINTVNGIPKLGLEFYGSEFLLSDFDLTNYIGDNQFHTYATTLNATTMEASVYFDGDLIASKTFGNTFGNSNTDVYLGLTPWNNADDLNAEVDFAAIWDGALADSEVAQLHSGALIPSNFPNGLVGYWDFDDNGTSFSDLSGNNNTATYGTNSTQSPDYSDTNNSSAYFEPESNGRSYLKLPEVDDQLGKVNSSATISVWFKIDDDPGGSILIHSNSDSENAIYGRVGFNNGGRLKIMLRKDSNDYDFTGSTSFSDSQGWNHFAYVIDANNETIKGYVNGVLEISQSYNSNINYYASSREWWIGDAPLNSSSSHSFGGWMDEIAIWDEALTDTQINQLYNSGNATLAHEVQTDHLRAYYDFENGSYSDKTGRGTDPTAEVGVSFSNEVISAPGSDFTFIFPGESPSDEELIIGQSYNLQWNADSAVNLSVQIDENYDLPGASAGWGNESWITLWSRSNVGSGGFTYSPPDPDWFFGSGNGDHHDLMDTTTEQHGRYRFYIEDSQGNNASSLNFTFKRNESGTYGNSKSLFLDHEAADFREIMPTMGKPDSQTTVSFWVKNVGDWWTNGDSGEAGIFVHNQLTDNSNFPRALRIGVSNSKGDGTGPNLYLYLYSKNDVRHLITGSAELVKNTWYHIAATIDHSTGQYKVYINGELDIDYNFGTGFDTTSLTERLWQLNGFTWNEDHHTFSAYYDEFAVWRTVLGQSEILSLYNNGIPNPATDYNSSDLVAYYPFEELESVGNGYYKTYDISQYRKHGYAKHGSLSTDIPQAD